MASSSTMPFGQTFETQVNNNMSEQDSVDSQDFKGKAPSSPMSAEACDVDYSEKDSKMKDEAPPRFSTIFQTHAPSAPVRAFQSYPAPTKKSGIFIATPLFWALFAIVMFESAVLFGYTVIGLLNNMPTKLVHFGGETTVVAGCNCPAQPVINISPNFGPQQPQQGIVTVTVTTSQSQIASSSTSTTSSSTSSTSSSTSTANPSSEAAVIASNLAGLLKGMTTSTTSTTADLPAVTQTTIVTPPGSVVKSTTLLLVDASGNPVTRPTVTATTVINESQASAASAAAASFSSLESRDASSSSVSFPPPPAAPLRPILSSSPAAGGTIIYTLTPSTLTSTTTLPDGGSTVTTQILSATEGSSWMSVPVTATTTMTRR